MSFMEIVKCSGCKVCKKNCIFNKIFNKNIALTNCKETLEIIKDYCFKEGKNLKVYYCNGDRITHTILTNEIKDKISINKMSLDIFMSG